MQRAQIQCLEVVSRKNYFPFTEIENVQGSTFVPLKATVVGKKLLLQLQ